MDFGPKLFPIFSHGNRADVRVGQLEKLEGLRTGLDGGSGGSPELTPPALAVFVLKALGFSLDTSARNLNGLKLVSREVCAADKSSPVPDLRLAQGGAPVVGSLPFSRRSVQPLPATKQNGLAGPESGNSGHASARGLGTFGPLCRLFTNGQPKAHRLFTHGLSFLMPTFQGSKRVICSSTASLSGLLQLLGLHG